MPATAFMPACFNCTLWSSQRGKKIRILKSDCGAPAGAQCTARSPASTGASWSREQGGGRVRVPALQDGSYLGHLCHAGPEVVRLEGVEAPFLDVGLPVMERLGEPSDLDHDMVGHAMVQLMVTGESLPGRWCTHGRGSSEPAKGRGKKKPIESVIMIIPGGGGVRGWWSNPLRFFFNAPNLVGWLY